MYYLNRHLNGEMNRLAVGRSARAQQTHKIHSSKILTIQQGITRGVSSVGKPCLVPFPITVTCKQIGFKICPLVTEFYSGQDRQQTHTHTRTDPNPRSAESQLWQTKKQGWHIGEILLYTDNRYWFTRTDISANILLSGIEAVKT